MAFHFSDIIKGKIINETETGISYREIAKKYGIGVGTVARLIKKNREGFLDG